MFQPDQWMKVKIALEIAALSCEAAGAALPATNTTGKVKLHTESKEYAALAKTVGEHFQPSSCAGKQRRSV